MWNLKMVQDKPLFAKQKPEDPDVEDQRGHQGKAGWCDDLGDWVDCTYLL